MSKDKPEIRNLIKKSYLAFIKNSVRTKAFKNFYALVDGKEVDVAKNGDLSCAYFVSAVLTIFGLIKKFHLTVAKTVEDLKESSWIELKRPRVGSILVWEKDQKGHQHIGFYIGRKTAISNRSSSQSPAQHNWQFMGKRKVEKIFWSEKIRN